MEYGKQIGHSVRVLSNLWRRELEQRTARSGEECLSSIQIGILEYINDMYELGTDIYQKDIESTFRIKRSTVSVLLKAMEDNGLINRVSVEEDARLKKLIPTALAGKHRELTKDIVDGLANDITKDISEEDILTFLTVINKMIKYLEGNDGLQEKPKGL